MKDAQFRTKDSGMLYKIGVHGKIFMWVNDNWILSNITRSELAARTEPVLKKNQLASECNAELKRGMKMPEQN